ncbi:hypothetical protein ACH5RR_040761 [Cinchona calisaya]|uniref:Uncharacterized protein n=1 Tax=Cinchona calisaya TaxID=153742 RepID=A0ABD2XSD6_9GENT
MEIRELKRKLMEAEECVLGKAELSKKIKLSLKELQDNVVLKIMEAEVNMKLRLMNIELRIQELNDCRNPPTPTPATDDEVEKNPEEVMEVEKEVEEEVHMEQN